MSFSQYLARQLGNPSSLAGRFLAPMWNRRNRALQDAALASLALNRKDRVLEVGCGGGSLLSRIAEVTTEGIVVGLDVSRAMVSHCERKHRSLVTSGRLALTCASAEAIPYPDTHFTKICTVNSVFYWPDALGAFAEFWRLLDVPGTLVVCFTRGASLRQKRFARHIRMYEPQEVMGLMSSCGFEDLRCRFASDRYREFACVTASKGAS